MVAFYIYGFIEFFGQGEGEQQLFFLSYIVYTFLGEVINFGSYYMNLGVILFLCKFIQE